MSDHAPDAVSDSDPPEVVAFRARWTEARNDHERLVVLAEHASEQLRITVEARRRVYADHEEIAQLATEAKAAAKAALVAIRLHEQRAGERDKKFGERLDVLTEYLGGILGELGQRARQDSKHDEEITATRQAVTKVYAIAIVAKTELEKTKGDLAATAADLRVAKLKAFGARATAGAAGYGAVEALRHWWPDIVRILTGG